MEAMIKLLGILFGVLARTLVPYLRKVKQGKVVKFDNKYWVSAAAAFILCVITTLLIFPDFNAAKSGNGLEASVKLFCLAFGFGYAWNSAVSEAAKWMGKKRI
jgi:hypothetical protein